MSEPWRKVPENPEYEMSKSGRLRGPGGALCMPDVSNRPVAAAHYAVPVGSGRLYLLVRDGMKKIWGCAFEPTVDWVREVRAEAMAGMEARRAAKRAAKASANALRKSAGRTKCKTSLASVDLSAPEEWVTLLDHPRYSLSNQGRLRSDCGLLSPNINGSSAATAKYQLWDARTRTQTSLTIRLAMAEVWGISFVPTSDWVKRIRQEVLTAIEDRRKSKTQAQPEAPESKPAPQTTSKAKAADSGGSSKPGKDTMNCPWATPGMLNKADLPPGIETWDCAEMDPMTHRGENGVWVDVPVRKRTRRAKQQEQEAA